MKAFWARLSDREKLFVGVGGAVAAFVIAFFLVLKPLSSWRADEAARRTGGEELYRLVAEASASAGVVAAQAGVDLETPVLNAVTQTTGEYAIIVNYRNARADGAVEANVAAPAAKIFDWLRALEARYGVSVAAADISRANSEGEVQAQITLVRRVAS